MTELGEDIVVLIGRDDLPSCVRVEYSPHKKVLLIGGAIKSGALPYLRKRSSFMRDVPEHTFSTQEDLKQLVANLGLPPETVDQILERFPALPTQ